MKTIKPATSLKAAKSLSTQAGYMFSAASTVKLYDGDKTVVKYLEQLGNTLSGAAREYYVKGK